MGQDREASDGPPVPMVGRRSLRASLSHPTILSPTRGTIVRFIRPLSGRTRMATASLPSDS